MNEERKINGHNLIKINSISMLRIIATLMVLMVHFGQSLPLPYVLHSVVIYGAEGVTVFFIISGYLIAASLDRNASNFYKKRLVRIIPVYYSVVIVNVFASIVFFNNYPADITHLGWFRYFLFIQAIVPTNDRLYWNNAASLWTMSAFMLFYLLAPHVHRFIQKDENSKNMKCCRSLGILWGGVLLSLISEALYSNCNGIFEGSGLYLATHSAFTVLFEFFVGMFLYYSYKEQQCMLWIGLIGALGTIFKIDRFVITSVFAIVVYSLISKEFEFHTWIGKVLKKLDEYSYSIYLGHTTVMFIAGRIQESAGFSDIKLAVLDLIGCVMFIPILHELIEKPANKGLKKVLKI